MELSVFIGVYPAHLLMMMANTRRRYLILFQLLTLPIVATQIDLIDGDTFPTSSFVVTKNRTTTYRLLPHTDTPSISTTNTIIITEPSTVFLPSGVESVKIEPNTYAPTELSDEIQAYYSHSMVWYGIFYVLYFFLSS